MVITGIIWGAAALSATPHWLQSIELRNDRKHCRIDRLIRLVPQFKAIELVLFYVIPLVIIAGLYCQISVVLWASSGHLHEGTRGGSRKGELSESDRHRKNVVKMLIACVTVYFLCYTPVNVMFVMKSLLDKRNFQPPYSILLVANALAYSCSGVNPLLYTVFCQKFRFRFHQLVTCKKVVSRGAEFSTVIPQDGSGDSFAGEGPASSRPLYARLRRDSSTFATRSTISSFRKSRRHSLTLIDFEESPGHNRKVLDFEMQADNGGFNQIISPTCLYRLKPESHFRAARDT